VTFDASISLGNILSAATIVGGIAISASRVLASVDKRLDLFSQTLEEHAKALQKHDAAIALYEERVFDLVGTLQRLVGRFESTDHPMFGSKRRSTDHG
jgi:hypothetical protein